MGANLVLEIGVARQQLGHDLAVAVQPIQKLSFLASKRQHA